MAGPVPAIHVFSARYAVKTWMPGTRPGMTSLAIRPDHTFSNGTSILLCFSSHSGTGRFFERMKSGLNSFD
jgi:hypothetical protein